MKIKKVDDKPMVIHTKEKAKIHAHEPKGAKIKGSNIYTVERGPKTIGAKVSDDKKKSYRKSTIHQSESKNKRLSRFERNYRESNTSIKTKNTNLHIAGRTGALAAGAVTEQMEGGQEVSQAAYLAYEASRSVTGTASKGAALFRKKAAAEAKKRIKKVEAGKKLAKKTAKKAAKDTAKAVAKETAKETAKTTAKVAAKTATKTAATAAGTAVAPGVGTAIGMAAGYAAGVSIEVKDEKMTNRSRKIKFFLDKMKAQENQTDSVAKLVKDLIVRKAITWVKAAAPVVGLVLLLLVLVVAMIAVPVIAVIAILYNSPFALFLPPLESGDTVQTVTSAYVQEFNRDVNTKVNEHTGYDLGELVYVDYEGMEENPKPTEVSIGSHKKVIWRCEKGHEWEVAVKSRTINKTGCPYCSHNKVLAGFNDLATLLPDIAAEWSDRNYPLLPTQVTVFANRKAWWKCKDCGREWNTLISTRSGGSKCPYCSGYIFLKGFNDLQTTHPEIASEWSEKNLSLKPDEVNAKSRKNVWWRCSKCGNEWKSVINARVKGTVCPVCAEREVLAGYNDLATTDSQLLSEWDYEQNKLKPTEVSRTSAKRAWWKCRHGHSWSMKINERTILNKGCRICEQEYLSLFPALAVSYYSNKKGLKAELGSDRLLGVPLETYIPSEKLAIESGSADENIEIMKAYMCKQRGIRLIKLPMKGTELDYADSLKKAFQSVHIFISSDTEEDVEIIKNTFERWRESQ